MTKQVLIDTDIISFFMRNDKNVSDNFHQHIAIHQFVYISRVSVLEILGGLKAKDAQRQIKDFRNFLSLHQILEITPESVEISTDIFATLYKKGRHSGNYDILIAGIALTNDLVLCTNNEKGYQNIPDLEIINWVKR
jgi:tRNA(fMet)-specific endonuclease VapC